jgi:hypothetical protein
MQRPLPDNTQHSQETDIHASDGFEPEIPASERPQTHALDRAAVSGIIDHNNAGYKNTQFEYMDVQKREKFIDVRRLCR